MQPKSLDLATLESAAGWYVDLRADANDPLLQAAHRQWLETDACHRRAWDRVLRLQGKFDHLASPTLARATITGASARRRDVLKVLAVLLAAGAGAPLAWRSSAGTQWAADERTGTGEQRLIRLEDGSQLQLNTATALNIRYGETLREVVLLRGEIMVETARDVRQRPFIVHTQEGSLRALGTRFVVLRDDAITRLTVVSHAVEVRPAQQPLVMATVTAGQQISFSDSSLSPITAADPQADAWTRNMLVVSNWRLADFLTQLQRYRPGYVSCAPAIAELRISGAFNLRDTDGMLENLHRTLPVRIRQFTPYWVRIEAA